MDAISVTATDVLDELECELNVINNLLLINASEGLDDHSNQVAALSERLAELVQQEPVTSDMKVRYQELVSRAKIISARCFWRATVVGNLMRDAGWDLGIYRKDGDIELVRTSAVGYQA